jgi:hypothetical protein
MCGWKTGLPITESYNATEYLNFLLNGFNVYPITIETTTSQSTTTNCITLSLSEDSNLSNLLNKWIDGVTGKTQYKFVNLPQLIPICIDRLKDGCKVDIMKKIQFNNKTQNNASWVIHSLICQTRSHYYALVYTLYGDWYLFDNNKLPSIIRVDITDSDISDKIKQECVIALYRIDDILCNI